MIDQSLLEDFTAQFKNLRIVVEQSAERIISDPPDILFYDNQNVFIKSYLVGACSILEAFIQDLAKNCTKLLQRRVNELNIPYNFINWIAEHDKAKLKFSSFEGRKTDKDVADMISPNYYKTIIAFQRIGFDISSEKVSSYKDYISSIVDKRNKIIHHNDSASDLSFTDITTVIDTFIAYAECLYIEVNSNPHIAIKP